MLYWCIVQNILPYVWIIIVFGKYWSLCTSPSRLKCQIVVYYYAPLSVIDTTFISRI